MADYPMDCGAGEDMKVDGKVGIGTSTPFHLLHVHRTDAGDLAGFSVGNYMRLKIGADGTYTDVTSENGNHLRLLDESGNCLILRTGGNVGIGTTVPGSKLQVNGNTAIGYSAETTAPTNGLTVNGKVGIGTTSPGANLDVRGDCKLQNGAAVNEFSTDGTLAGNSDTAIPTEKAVKTYVDGVAGCKWQTQAGYTNIYKNDGNVGIGTNAPTEAKLVVYGGAIRTKLDANSWAELDYTSLKFDGNGSSRTVENQDGSLQVRGDGTTMTLSLTGIALAANTTVSGGLTVTGNGKFQGVTSGTYANPLNLTSDGTLTTATSDRRKKKDIAKLDDVIGKVAKLRGVSFRWKDSQVRGKQIGMIAQEVEKVYPELVFTNPTDGFKGIRYAELTAVLVEVVKEQQTRIVALERAAHRRTGGK